MTRAELEKVVKEQQQRDALKEDDMGGKNSNSSEAIALVDEGESEGGSPLVDNTEISEGMEMVNVNVAVRDDAVLRRERMEDNTEKMDMHRPILTTAKEFKDEIENIRTLKITLIDQFRKIEEEKKAIDEANKSLDAKRCQFEKDQETYKINMQLKIEKQEDEKELMLIQEAVERNVEALLGSMTESAFEIADVLEETDKNIEIYKSDNEELRKKLWKSIEAIEEKNTEIEEWINEAETWSNENEELKREISLIKRQYEVEMKINEIMRNEMKSKENKRTGRH